MEVVRALRHSIESRTPFRVTSDALPPDEDVRRGAAAYLAWRDAERFGPARMREAVSDFVQTVGVVAPDVLAAWLTPDDAFTLWRNAPWEVKSVLESSSIFCTHCLRAEDPRARVAMSRPGVLRFAGPAFVSMDERFSALCESLGDGEELPMEARHENDVRAFEVACGMHRDTQFAAGFWAFEEEEPSPHMDLERLCGLLCAQATFRRCTVHPPRGRALAHAIVDLMEANGLGTGLLSYSRAVDYWGMPDVERRVNALRLRHGFLPLGMDPGPPLPAAPRAHAYDFDAAIAAFPHDGCVFLHVAQHGCETARKLKHWRFSRMQGLDLRRREVALRLWGIIDGDTEMARVAFLTGNLGYPVAPPEEGLRLAENFDACLQAGPRLGLSPFALPRWPERLADVFSFPSTMLVGGILKNEFPRQHLESIQDYLDRHWEGGDPGPAIPYSSNDDAMAALAYWRMRGADATKVAWLLRSHQDVPPAFFVYACAWTAFFKRDVRVHRDTILALRRNSGAVPCFLMPLIAEGDAGVRDALRKHRNLPVAKRWLVRRKRARR